MAIQRFHAIMQIHYQTQLTLALVQASCVFLQSLEFLVCTSLGVRSVHRTPCQPTAQSQVTPSLLSDLSPDLAAACNSLSIYSVMAQVWLQCQYHRGAVSVFLQRLHTSPQHLHAADVAATDSLGKSTGAERCVKKLALFTHASATCLTSRCDPAWLRDSIAS